MKTALTPFIAIEGMDGSGKTTLIRRLEEYLSLMSDYRYAFTHEPGGSPLAEAVRGILLDDSLSGNASGKTQLLGFFYARSHHLGMIRKKREVEFVVITDRFDGSTFAYQVYGESKGPEEQEELDELFWMLRANVVLGGNEPTLYLYLDLPPETAFARRSADTSQAKNHYDEKPLSFYRRQHAGYDDFLKEIASQGDSEVAFIDATLPPDDVFEEAFRVIHDHVRRITSP